MVRWQMYGNEHFSQLSINRNGSRLYGLSVVRFRISSNGYNHDNDLPVDGYNNNRDRNDDDLSMDRYDNNHNLPMDGYNNNRNRNDDDLSVDRYDHNNVSVDGHDDNRYGNNNHLYRYHNNG